jgi:Overcoming lysogenization defect protein-like, TOPRIM domain
VDRAERTRLAQRALAGYSSGADAPIAATKLALKKVQTARAVIFVEGISDQMAIETLAARRGRDLDAERVAVLPVGGAQAARRYLRILGPVGEQRRLAGFCDADGSEAFRRGLIKAGLGSPRTAREMANLGFFVCVDDLEDELIRAVGTDGVEAVLRSQGDLHSFRTLQSQPAWRGRPTRDQLRRFFGSIAGRNLRYARLLVESVELDRVPPPLDAVLAHV